MTEVILKAKTAFCQGLSALIAAFSLNLASVALGAEVQKTDDAVIIDDVRVAPLVKSKWDQKYAGGNPSGGDPCYNYYTPYQCYCGCGPTCFAQIMRYHEWPKTAVDTGYSVYNFEDGLTKKVETVESYRCKYNGTLTNLTMIGGVYDWSKMPYETKTSGTPDAEREMIGRLCHDLGVSVGADYNSAVGTGASSPAFIHSLMGNFHYADAAAVEWSLTTNMRTYDQANLLRALLPNLDAGLPCALMIDGSGARHIIVCDGYGYHGGVLYLHLNVGYSGNWDGWYPVEGNWSWSINGQSYTFIAGIVYNISPHFNGPIVSGRIVDAADNPVVGASVSVLSDGVVVTNVISGARGNYVFKVPPGDYAVVVEKGTLSRTEYLTLKPCISSAYMQNGDYYQTPVAVRIANKVDEDILLDADAPTVAAPTSIPADGSTFKGSQYVELYTQTEGAAIHYTLDGSIPDRESPLYTEPFEITSATTVRAIALKDGAYPSEIGTFKFIESTYGEILGTSDTLWTSGGFAPWCKDEETYYSNQENLNGLLRSGIPLTSQGKGSATWLEAEIDGPAKVSFEYRYNPYYKSPFVVTTDGAITNVFEEIYYVSDPTWTKANFEVAAGRHVVRFEYRAGGWGLQYSNGVHLRKMDIVYPNVLTTSLGSSGIEQWTWLTFANGVQFGKTWNQLGSSSAKVTINGQSFERKLTIDQDATMESLTLKGVTSLVSADGHKLTANTVKVDGAVTVGAGSLEVTGALMLMTKSSTVVIADGVDIIPVSAVSGGRIISEKVTGGTRYSLALAYVSPFSATPSGTANWSALTFTDRNNNQATWGALDAGTQSRVTLNATGSAIVNVNVNVSLKSLLVSGSGSLTLKSTTSNALTVETTTVNADLEVTSALARLGAVTLSAGESLSVPSADVFTSVTGAGTLEVGGSVWPTQRGLADPTWTGTLRLTGGLSGVCDLDALGHAGSQVIFAGTLASGGEMRVTRELTVASTANVQGAVVLTNLSARVVVKDGATVNVTSGIEHYEPVATTNGTDVVYTLTLAKVTHVGPYAVTLESSANWADIIWTDANNAPGKWADLESSGNDVFSINAANDVVITMSGSETASKIVTTGSGMVTLLYDAGKDVPAGMRGCLQDSSWKGTVKLAGTRTFAGTDLGEYGNAGSTIELAGSISGTLKNGCRCESTLILSCTVTLKALATSASYTFAGKLLGTGEFAFDYNSNSSERLYFTGDATEFRGYANADHWRTVVFGDPGSETYADGQVIVLTELVLGPQPYYSSVSSAVLVYGKLTIEEGASVKSGWQTATPIKLSSLTAQVLIKEGCGITPVSGIAGETLKSEKIEGGTLWTFENAPSEEEEDPVVPFTDEMSGGTIAVNDDGEYVVTPLAESFMVAVYDVGTNTIVVPPQISWVYGVPPAQLRVRHGSQDITDAFLQADCGDGWHCLALSEEGSVKVGDETISVRPVLSPVGSDELATVPFAVGDDVSVGVKTIPGLRYALMRGATLETLSDESTSEGVTNEVAETTRLRLRDSKPPSGQAFYLITVGLP